MDVVRGGHADRGQKRQRTGRYGGEMICCADFQKKQVILKEKDGKFIILIHITS